MGGSADEKHKDRPAIAAARQKIARYCAYQERSHREVEQKLYEYGLYTDQVQEVMAWLITENFLNEERYALTFAGGKFRVKKWGRLKIKQHLARNNVAEYSINKALAAINEDDYRHTLRQLIEQKKTSVTAPNIYELRHKIARHVISKGYEPELVWEEIKTIVT